jgi:hypothetical protein
MIYYQVFYWVSVAVSFVVVGVRIWILSRTAPSIRRHMLSLGGVKDVILLLMAGTVLVGVSMATYNLVNIVRAEQRLLRDYPTLTKWERTYHLTLDEVVVVYKVYVKQDSACAGGLVLVDANECVVDIWILFCGDGGVVVYQGHVMCNLS